MQRNDPKIREGDLYQSVTVDGIRFDIVYGYYEEFERETGEPVPIYPDLVKSPAFTKDGYRIVTQIQSPCKHFSKRHKKCDSDWCRSCKHYEDEYKPIGICRCVRNKATGGTVDEKTI